MFNYSKDGVVVSTVLDARTINKEGKYPVKIKVRRAVPASDPFESAYFLSFC